jgi:ribosome-associated protein
VDDLPIDDALCIPGEELEERFVRSSGPGGQNVNKVSTKVELRFDAANSTVLDDSVRERLLKLAGRRATVEGVIVLEAQSERSRERNRQDARERLVELIRRALVRPRKRKPTRPTRASKEKRLQEKNQRGRVKQKRGPVRGEDSE